MTFSSALTRTWRTDSYLPKSRHRFPAHNVIRVGFAPTFLPGIAPGFVVPTQHSTWSPSLVHVCKNIKKRERSIRYWLKFCQASSLLLFQTLKAARKWWLSELKNMLNYITYTLNYFKPPCHIFPESAMTANQRHSQMDDMRWYWTTLYRLQRLKTKNGEWTVWNLRKTGLYSPTSR